MDSLDSMGIGLDMLLVDRNTTSLNETSSLLQMIGSCRVKPTRDATLAASLVRERSTGFDVVLIDETLLNVEGHKLLREALRRGSTVIVMSANAKRAIEKYAIEDGTYLLVQNPPNIDVLKCLCQNVLKEKTQRISEKLKSTRETSTAPSRNGVGSMRREAGIVWTPELQEKFIDVARFLGEEKCSPERILGQFNVPGLTVTQVADHLQRCISNGWIRGFRPKITENRNRNDERVQVPLGANEVIKSPVSPAYDDQVVSRKKAINDQVVSRTKAKLQDDDWVKVDQEEVGDMAQTVTEGSALQSRKGLKKLIKMISPKNRNKS